MPQSSYQIAEMEARIRRLAEAIDNFQYARARLEKLHQTAEGSARAQLEQALAVNQAAIEARKRDLALGMERLLKARSNHNELL